MDEIEHKLVEVNGLKIHVAEIGKGSKTVVFCHGFPEIWYSWRHQMVALAQAGYRAIAFDYRGYGLSDLPPEPDKTTWSDLINDLHSLFDPLGISKAFLVAKGFGSRVAYMCALMHPKQIAGIVTLGVPFVPPVPPAIKEGFPEGFYISRWQEPGRAEADFGRFDPKTVVRNLYILLSKSEAPIAGENQEIMDLVDPSTPLPSWFTEEDLSTYAVLYHKSGFQTALTVPYRTMNEKFEIADSQVKVEAPVLVIIGDKDFVPKFPAMEAYIKSGQLKMFVPLLETVYIPQGCHFVQEQFPRQVNDLILTFLNNHTC